MSYTSISKLYSKLFYKYCYYCRLCDDYKHYFFIRKLPTPTSAEIVDYHVNICCKDKEELKRKIEEEIKLIKEEEEKRKKNKRLVKKELKQIKKEKNTILYAFL